MIFLASLFLPTRQKKKKRAACLDKQQKNEISNCAGLLSKN